MNLPKVIYRYHRHFALYEDEVLDWDEAIGRAFGDFDSGLAAPYEIQVGDRIYGYKEIQSAAFDRYY